MITLAYMMLTAQMGANLVQDPGFEVLTGETPAHYDVSGAVKGGYAGYRDEIATTGVVLDSECESGEVSQLVHLDPSGGRWVTFEFRGKAEEGFAVKVDELYMQLDFYSNKGTNYLDTVRRLIYREVLKDRKDFTLNGDFGKFGASVWRSYSLEELLPFKEADAVRVTVGFKGGAGTAKGFSRFFATDFSLVQRSESLTGKVDPAEAKTVKGPSAEKDISSLVSLGGRWYYKPGPGEQIVGGNVVVNEANADRLFYKDDHLSNPFAGNMTAWLRKGYKDKDGNIVQEDRLVPDNVVLTFDGSNTLQITTHDLPNHPTGKFPDTFGTQGYNPNYIQEKVVTYRIPINPQRNPNAVAMTKDNSNMGLNMGPIGIAVNGVVFFNPFDANMQDATNIMDRCCGHPAPDNTYHYHKYPICVNTPFVDKGEEHSPLIGFALDGFPIYGPYEARDLLARDLTENKLDAFNAHYDPVRGWHYHVTPGKFPYVIGGYMGTVER